MLTADEMMRIAEAAARLQGAVGGDEVHKVTLVADPQPVGDKLWIIRVRLMMRDGTAKAFECDSTDVEVFAVREVPP